LNTKEKGKFKKLKPISDDIMDDFLINDLNMSEISEKYDVHYSNLRRFIKHELKERNLEQSFNVQYFNVEDFQWLDIGDTFQFAEWLTVWRVNKIIEKENELVFEISPSTTKNARRHWVNDELQEQLDVNDAKKK
jgi:hypothetical protein